LQEPRAREPIFTAPWPALALVALILGGYVLQVQLGDPSGYALALVPTDLAQGRWIELVTHIFVHAGWPHALFNAAGVLIFGTPVARLIGVSPARAMAFFLFYLICGIAAGGLFAWADLAAFKIGGLPGFHFDPSRTDLVGASGAISGLVGAAARLMGGDGRLGPVFSRLSVGMAAAWTVANAIIGVVGFAPGAGDQPVAWQVHIIGFFVGLLLIGPWAALFGRRLPEPEPAPEPEAPQPIGWR
jgi:membrane associated rhomboid family serine protease